MKGCHRNGLIARVKRLIITQSSNQSDYRTLENGSKKPPTDIRPAFTSQLPNKHSSTKYFSTNKIISIYDIISVGKIHLQRLP